MSSIAPDPRAATPPERADRSLDLRVLATAVAVAAALLGILLLSAQVTAGGTQEVDERILASLRHPDDPARLRGPEWLAAAARDVTALGGAPVLVLLVLAVVGFLALHRRWRLTVAVLLSTVGAMDLSSLLKGFFARPRPSIVPHLVGVESASYPSGHAIMAAAVYLTLAGLVARTVATRRAKLYVLAVALAAAALVAVSRIALGVHYPTDVLAGLVVGGLWALTCDALVLRLQRRGTISE